MKVVVINGLGPATVMDATQVVVLFDNGTPACVAQETARGVTCCHAQEPNFNQVLAGLGMDRVTVSRIRPRPPLEILGG